MKTVRADNKQADESPSLATDCTRKVLQFALHYAILAPSSHNTQPWRFEFRGDELELFADRSRALPLVDPRSREMVMSCGAALLNLRLAIRYLGYADETSLLPDPGQPDLLAHVRVGPARPATPEDRTMFDAIPKRHTNRLTFQHRAIPDLVIDTLRAAVQEEGAWLHVVRDGDDLQALANLVWEADRIQCADRGCRRELAAWLRANRSRRRDGIPGYALGLSDAASVFVPAVMRAFDLGRRTSEKDWTVAASAPALVVLGTEDDFPGDWLRAGQAVEKLLLLACAHGISASFFNQPLQVAELRPQVRAALVETGFPQLLLRLGYGTKMKQTPRRGVREVATRRN
jgi:nitroreductase